MFYIYKITNKINQKVYIGRTNNLKRRIRAHKYCKNGFLIHKAINKYGKDNFEFIVLLECDKFEESVAAEIEYIKQYKSNICEYGTDYGYNLTNGGEGAQGYKHTEEARLRQSESKKGELNHFYGKKHTAENMVLFVEMSTGENNAFYGKKHKPETIKLLSESKIGLYIGEENPFYGKHHDEVTKSKLGELAKQRWENRSEEEKQKIISKSHESRRNSPNRGNKLNIEKVLKIKEMIKDGKTNVEISNTFKVSAVMISRIRLGKSWADIV